MHGRFAISLCVLVCTAFSAAGADAISANPRDFKVEIDNRYVRVLRSHFEPGARREVYESVGSCVVFLTDVHTRFTAADGSVEEFQGKAGTAGWLKPGRHAEENLSAQAADYVVIELKPERVKEAPIMLDPVSIDPKYHSVAFENDRVRAIRTVLEPHIKSPAHEHPSYVVVYLTELHTTMTMADGRVLDNPRKPGDIGYRDRLKHVTENIGPKTAMEIQVELKGEPVK